MSRDFTVTINDNSERAQIFMQIFGRLTVPVKSFIPELVTLPDVDGLQSVYRLDLDLITADERQSLVNHIVLKFNTSPQAAKSSLALRGIPILADECVLTVHNPQKWIT